MFNNQGVLYICVESVVEPYTTNTSLISKPHCGILYTTSEVLFMLYLSENFKKYRILKNYTQEDVANFLNVTSQSVSKWERGESYPDITLLPAIANIFETSIDLLLGMDSIRAAETRYNIHKKANECMRNSELDEAEKIYRDALLIYPNKPGMILGLASVLALKNETVQAIELMERGLPLSQNEKQKATIRAVLCLLYKKCGFTGDAEKTALELPHMRECREVILPIITSEFDECDVDAKIKEILLGE